jgi:hypothetical protein
MATFGTFTAGQVLTAAELNSTGAWTSYTPTWTQVATITKTVNWARYMQLGKLVEVHIKMTASSAGTAGGLILVGLPVTASADNRLMGIGTIAAASSNNEKPLFSIFSSSTTVRFRSVIDDASQLNALSDNAPNSFTIASGDIINCKLTYEAA